MSLVDGTIIVQVIVIVGLSCCHCVIVVSTFLIVEGHSLLLMVLHMENRCIMHGLLTNVILAEEESVPEVRVGGFYEVGLGDHAISLSVVA